MSFKKKIPLRIKGHSFTKSNVKYKKTFLNRDIIQNQKVKRDHNIADL